MKIGSAIFNLVLTMLLVPVGTHAEKNERALAYLEDAKKNIAMMLERYPPSEGFIPFPGEDFAISQLGFGGMDRRRSQPWVLLLDIAKAQSKAGDHGAALETMAQIMEIFSYYKKHVGESRQKEVKRDYEWVLENMASAFALLGEYEAVLKIVHEDDPSRSEISRDSIVQDLAWHQIRAGELSAAIENLNLSSRRPDRKNIRALSALEEYDLALELARNPPLSMDSFREIDLRLVEFFQVAEQMVENGHIENAVIVLDEARQMLLAGEPHVRPFTLIRLLIKSGNPSDALQLAMNADTLSRRNFVRLFVEEEYFQQAIALADKIGQDHSENGSWRYHATLAWAQAYATISIGLVNAKNQLLADILADRVVNFPEESRPSDYDRARLQILAAVGRTEQVVQNIKEKYSGEFSIEEASLLLNILTIQLQAGQAEAIESTLPIILKIVKSNPDFDWHRTESRWVYLISALAQGGTSQQRLKLLESGIFRYAYVNLIAQLALQCIDEGDPDGALEIAGFIHDPEYASSVYADVASFYMESGNFDVAREILNEATVPVENSAYKIWKEERDFVLSGRACQAFRYIAATRGKLGLIDNAEASIKELPSDLGKAYGYLGLAEGMLGIGVIPAYFYNGRHRNFPP